MEYKIKHRPSFALLEISLPQNEKITAEAGALIYMEDGVEVKTRTRKGSLFKKLKTSVLGGESFFVNDYMAHKPAKIGFSAPPLGDIEHLETKLGTGFIIQSGAYIASTQNVRLDTEWQGFKKGIFGTQLFMLKTTGEGQVFFNAFGALEKIVLETNKTITVDNYHLVAFSDSCKYKVTKFGSLKSTIFGGEGLVTEVTGPGDVFIQTKSPSEFAKWISPFLPVRRDSRGARPEINVGGFRFGPGR